jgi:hypothetical protein
MMAYGPRFWPTKDEEITRLTSQRDDALRLCDELKAKLVEAEAALQCDRFHWNDMISKFHVVLDASCEGLCVDELVERVRILKLSNKAAECERDALSKSICELKTHVAEYRDALEEVLIKVIFTDTVLGRKVRALWKKGGA